MKIIALDAFRYTVQTAPKGINGEADLVTFGGDVGDSITFDAFGGGWYVSAEDLIGCTLSIAPVEPKPAATPAAKGAIKPVAPFGGYHSIASFIR